MLGVLLGGSTGPNAQGVELQQRCVEAVHACWMANGDHIAHIYTGTGALGGGRSKITDAALSTKRALQKRCSVQLSVDSTTRIVVLVLLFDMLNTLLICHCLYDTCMI